MRLARALGRLIAVESQTAERSRSQPGPPDPAAGARWGGPASFDIPSRPEASDQQASLTYDWIDRARRFRGVESHREYVLSAAAVGGAGLEPEAIRSVTFYLGEREERRERREQEGGQTRLTPIVETIREYVKLSFPFGDPQGARGKPHPPETPPREEPDFG